MTVKRKRYLLISLGVVTITIVAYMHLDYAARSPPAWTLKRKCYLPITPPSPNATEDARRFLPDIGKESPPPPDSIFFHETSCAENYRISLNARQACAIESAAKANPQRHVYVLFISPRMEMDQHSDSHLRSLRHYANIKFRNVDMWEYARGTTVEEWINDNVIFTSAFVTFHLSDLMRYLSLNKYGGTYLDMDVIVLQSFDGHRNYAAAESDDVVAAGIINFDDSPVGRLMRALCLRDFKLNYSGTEWGTNGPGVITRVLETICAIRSNTTLMTAERCYGFRVLPPSKCYAISWRHWETFFDAARSQEVQELLKDSLIAHFWNKHSIARTVQVGDGSPYDTLAKAHCPRVYESVGRYF